MATTVPDNVLGILSTAEIDGNVLRLTCGQLDRKDYVAVNKVLEAMGGKWNRKLSGHVFENDPTDVLDDIILTGEVTDAKREFQAFYTPETVATRLVELANIQDGEFCLEPSAGKGHILRFMTEYDCDIDYCEIMKYETGDITSASNEWSIGKARVNHKADDFLTYEPGEVYDKVIANPPFSKQQDIDHVSHMIDCCKPGGRVVTIMSPGFTFRQDKKTKAFRDKLDTCAHYETHEVESGAFKESGTMVKTVILVINK